jgi:hypothetical protein
MIGTHNTDTFLQEEIHRAESDAELVHLVREYHGDLARSDRTARPTLYLHIGLLCAAAERLLEHARIRRIES